MPLISPHSDAAQSARIKRYISDIGPFSRYAVKQPLRPYQLDPARTILHSVTHGLGLTVIVLMARQAGKNEMSAQVEALLLTRYQRLPVHIVKTAPTFHPQLQTSLERVIGVLDNPSPAAAGLAPTQPSSLAALVSASSPAHR